MTTPSKPSKNKVRALVRIIFGGVAVVYRYDNMNAAFKACEAVSNAMFNRASGKDIVPLIKGSVPLEHIGMDEKGDVVTDVQQCITSTFRIDDISFVGVVCPCCGEQIFDKIKPFNEAGSHDTTEPDDDDEQPDPAENWKQ